ncbi:helix-turn-helix domain-containing protein, partial [Streptomyces scabiei]|uniref:helix-turn-helix domain-containing protein n=1 Tax=Streptomyces scabiei TaxID=1930 RepID=UPI0038F7D4A7
MQFTRRVVNAYGLGASIRDIAGVTNRSFGAVRRVLLNSGVKLRGRGRAHNGIRPPLTYGCRRGKRARPQSCPRGQGSP